MSITLEIPDLVDQFLEKSRIPSQRQETLRSSLGAEEGPYVWHGQDDIRTLEGLAGVYMWTESLPTVQQITFVFAAGMVGSDGSYEIFYGQQPAEQGLFHCVPNNPAIGWAAITLAPSGGGALRSFIIKGMLTDAEWEIESMTLAHIGQSGPSLPLFSVMRIGA